MHRCHGSTTDITPDAWRALTKLKATITQRFVLEGCEVDAESDCRFCFFWEKDGTGKWGARFVRHWYEKDKLIPVNPCKVPKLDEARLETYPPGYRYLSYCQEVALGLQVKRDMPGHPREGESLNKKMHDTLLWQCKGWLDGDDVVV